MPRRYADRVITWRRGTVTTVIRSGGGTSDLRVILDRPDGREVRALAYIDLVGELTVGTVVLLNSSAFDLGLGTGGYALVVAAPDHLPPDLDGGPGHLVKARYTPLQTTVLGVDEQDSPYYELLRNADDIAGTPVVVADLHSALPAIVAGVRAEPGGPDRTIAYVMTDGAALPAAFSRTVDGLRSAGWLNGTVTVGQAYGGDLEAVTLHSGLLAARHVLRADIVVVTQGPGNLGTGTRWGFSGVAAGDAVNAVAVLGGRPVAALRISEADSRDRHRGISHHSLTAYGRVAAHAADVVVPELPEPLASLVARQLDALGPLHRRVRVEVDGLIAALRESPVPLSTMGRGLDEDAAYFVAAAAAGRHAARLVASRPSRP